MKNNKGFVLLETLITSTVVATVLIYLFVQTNNLKASYDSSFRYNDVDDLYRLSSIKDYINSLTVEERQVLKDNIESKSLILISANGDTYDNIELLDNQINRLKNLDIKNLVITTSDIDNIDTNDLDGNLKKFIKRIDNNSDNYRLIAEFNNDNCATLYFDMEGVWIKKVLQ